MCFSLLSLTLTWGKQLFNSCLKSTRGTLQKYLTSSFLALQTVCDVLRRAWSCSRSCSNPILPFSKNESPGLQRASHIRLSKSSGSGGIGVMGAIYQCLREELDQYIASYPGSNMPVVCVMITLMLCLIIMP